RGGGGGAVEDYYVVSVQISSSVDKACAPRSVISLLDSDSGDDEAPYRGAWTTHPTCKSRVSHCDPDIPCGPCGALVAFLDDTTGTKVNPRKSCNRLPGGVSKRSRRRRHRGAS
ncbi:hypothetical protein LCGC14_2703700, partial [marine sediment metagenome]